MRAGRDGGLRFLEGAGGRRAPRLPAAAVASAPAGRHLGLEGVVIAVIGLGKVAITQRAEGEGVVLEQLGAREVTLGPIAVLDPVAGRLSARRLPGVELLVRRGGGLLAGHDRRHLARRRLGPVREAHRAARVRERLRPPARLGRRRRGLGATRGALAAARSRLGLGLCLRLGLRQTLRRRRPRRVPFELEVGRALAPELLGVVDGALTAAWHGPGRGPCRLVVVGPEHAHAFALTARQCLLFVFETERIPLVVVAPVGHGTPSGPRPG